MATVEELEDLMERASNAFEVLLRQVCLDRDEVDVTGQVIAGAGATIDLLANMSARDKTTLRDEGAVAGLRILARLIGDTSGIATMSFQIDG